MVADEMADFTGTHEFLYPWIMKSVLMEEVHGLIIPSGDGGAASRGSDYAERSGRILR